VVGEQRGEAVEVPLVHDLGQVRRAGRVRAVELLEGTHQVVHQLGLLPSGDEDVVGRDAGLPGVEALAPRQALGDHLEGSVGAHDRG
jgi:hypothetical protein